MSLCGCGSRAPDDGGRSGLAASDAGRVQHAHVLAENSREFRKELARPGHLAGDRVAHAHRDRRRRRLTLLDHVEMVVEGRNLVDLRHRKLHLVGECDQTRGREMPVAVLDSVQILDQEIAPARIIPEQRPYFLPRLRIDLAALGPGTHSRRPGRNLASLLTLHMPSLLDARSVAYAGKSGNSRNAAV